MPEWLRSRHQGLGQETAWKAAKGPFEKAVLCPPISQCGCRNGKSGTSRSMLDELRKGCQSRLPTIQNSSYDPENTPGVIRFSEEAPGSYYVFVLSGAIG